ncbi:MAG TPA: hypothetical protein VGN97_14760 [Mesorhizobium sp.]|jgi:hypothetical protein|nr:hypothetical protein [Mesorhizobium sp.]
MDASGQTDLGEAQRHTDAVNRRGMAKKAMESVFSHGGGQQLLPNPVEPVRRRSQQATENTGEKEEGGTPKGKRRRTTLDVDFACLSAHANASV